MTHQTVRKETSITEDQMKKFSSQFELTEEEILEYKTEFRAYDKDGDGNITGKQKVRFLY